MKKIIFCCAFIILFVIVIMTGSYLLKPIAKVGNETVRIYEFIQYSLSDKQQVLERIADDIAFQKLTEERKIKITNEEIQREMNELSKYSDISYETCRKSMLQQKVIESYAAEIDITAENARAYYENNMERYGETEPDFIKIKSDMKMELGVSKYEERLYEIRKAHKVDLR